MKKRGMRIIFTAVSVISASAVLSAIAVYGLSSMPNETDNSDYDGFYVSTVKNDIPFIDDRVPACGDESSCGEAVSDASQCFEEPSDYDGILIRAIDLSHFGADGKPEALVSNFSGLNVDMDTIGSLPIAGLECDGRPEVLIYHTHAAESYAEGDTYEEGHIFLSENDEENMVAVGNEFAAVLESHGIGVIHDVYHHSSDGYNQAYSSSRRSIIDTLSKYSTIKIVIDIHRDAVSSEGSERKPLTYIKENPTAQVMLVVGSKYNGWQGNLANALALQKTMNGMFPTLARPIYFSKGEYNQSLFSGAMLLEVGAAGNNIDEAKNAARLAAEAFCNTFKATTK